MVSSYFRMDKIAPPPFSLSLTCGPHYSSPSPSSPRLPVAAVGPAFLPLPRACTTGGRHSPHARASRCSSSARRKRALPLAACRAPTCVSPLDTMASTSASRITSSGDDRTYLPVSSSIFVSSSAGTGVGEWRSQI
jgi:hypothetical protein